MPERPLAGKKSLFEFHSVWNKVKILFNFHKPKKPFFFTKCFNYKHKIFVWYKGSYIKYVGGGEGGGAGGWRVFVGAMKYFSHILMGHEIFFQIFDGPRNIFLCSFSIILFFKLKGCKHKISKLAIKEI